ncbi:hypothetical protein [Rhizobium sp. CIAT894]|uniref:hypothetical protein n=1 Tax=Rhizobium sp. CIAT894 TaxID=2020312 RepID=UPI0001909D6C|nr:hypothetical protein [Rhizobium sp. CIAT894]
MTEQAPFSSWDLPFWYRKLSRFSKLIGAAGATIAVAGFVVAAVNLAFGVSIWQNPSERYRVELADHAKPIIDASYSLLAKPGVTERLLGIEDIPQRRAAMEAIFTSYIEDGGLEGTLEQAVDTYDRIVRCHASWFCRFDDYDSLNDQMINIWFSYAGKIQQMRGKVTASDFGVPLEHEAERLRAEQKARVG